MGDSHEWHQLKGSIFGVKDRSILSAFHACCCFINDLQRERSHLFKEIHQASCWVPVLKFEINHDLLNSDWSSLIIAANSWSSPEATFVLHCRQSRAIVP